MLFSIGFAYEFVRLDGENTLTRLEKSAPYRYAFGFCLSGSDRRFRQPSPEIPNAYVVLGQDDLPAQRVFVDTLFVAAEVEHVVVKRSEEHTSELQSR